jgi:hypothetical protein
LSSKEFAYASESIRMAAKVIGYFSISSAHSSITGDAKGDLWHGEIDKKIATTLPSLPLLVRACSRELGSYRHWHAPLPDPPH